MFDSLDARLAAEFEPLGLRHLHNIASPVVVWRWRVPGPSDAADSHVATLPFNGQQFLDPKVARLLVELHMRSARLALSDAVDAILMGPDAGQNLDFGDGAVRGLHERGDGPTNHVVCEMSIRGSLTAICKRIHFQNCAFSHCMRMGPGV